MLKSSTNKIILHFQVMFSLVSPSSLLKFTNQLTHKTWIKFTDVFLYGSKDQRTDLPSSKQPLPHLLDILEFLLSKWLAITNLHCTGEASWFSWIYSKKKSHLTLRSCLLALRFDPTTLIEIAVYLSWRIISNLSVFNTVYIGLFDRSLLPMSLIQVELALKQATFLSPTHLYPCTNSTLFEQYMRNN